MKPPKGILLVVFFLILLSCKEECDEYYLGSLKNMNPYNGNEVLIYNNSTGDDIIFNGNGRNNWLNTFDHNGECVKVEIDDCIYWDSEYDYRIIISLRPTTFYQSAYLSIDLSDYTYNESWHYRSLINFNIPLDKDNLDVDQFYYDSLLVNNTMQYDVFSAIPKLGSAKEVLMDTIHPSMIYYNITSGLITVDFDDGSTWELKEIIN